MISLVSSQKGSFLAAAILAVLVFAIAGSAFLSRSHSQNLSSSESRQKRALAYVVEGAAEIIALNIRKTIELYGFERMQTIDEQLISMLSENLAGFDKYNVVLFSFAPVPGSYSANFIIPYNELPEYRGALAYKDAYTARIRVSSTTNRSESYADATISAYGIPIFGDKTVLADGIIQFYPGSQYIVKGRLHSNTGIRAGTMGGPIIFSPTDFNNATKAITTAGKIWHTFILRTGGWDYSYISTDTSRLVEVQNNNCWDSSCMIPFHKNALGDYSMNYSVDCQPTMNPTNHCWVDDQLATTGYKYFNMEIDPKNFNDRIAAGTGTIRPLWYDALNQPGSHDLNDIIQPMNINRYGNADRAEVERTYKPVYKADIRIVNKQSIDINGSVISTGDLSYTNLVNKGVIIEEPRSFYMPIAGRDANVYKLDVQKLSANFPSVNHIYIGSTTTYEGEVHFPTPNCTGASGGLPAVCARNDGTDCTASCSSANIGTFDMVMLVNGSQLPPSGLTVSSNLMALVQGNYNTVGQNPAMPVNFDKTSTNYNPARPAAIYADTVGYLSNSWDKSGWDPDNPTGPRLGSSTTYNFSYMSGLGKELNLIESWSGTLNRGMSAVYMFDSRQFPPRAGSRIFTDWHRRAFSMYYSPATWTNLQMDMGNLRPPDADNTYFTRVQSITPVATE